MIPLDTPPGTEIVCIDAEGRSQLGSPSPLQLWAVYTVSHWASAPILGRAVSLCEVDEQFGFDSWGFAPYRFRLLVLPKELTDLLTQAPLEKEPA